MTKQVAMALQAQQAGAPPPMLLRQQLGAQATMDWNEAPMQSSANYTNAAMIK